MPFSFRHFLPFLTLISCQLLTQSPTSSSAAPSPPKQLILPTNGTAYTRLTQSLGEGSYEVPDCAHNVTHIKTLYDAILKKRVFAFDLHLNYDNDRCKKFDRQRTEIKVFDRSPGWMMGRDGKTFSYSWKFKLQENFTVGDQFCHIHQIKLTGQGSLPNLTISTRKSVIDIKLLKPDGKLRTLTKSPIENFKGNWVSAREVITFGSAPTGCYSIFMKQVLTNKTVMNFSECNVTMSGAGTDIRPKWGIYRSIKSKMGLKNQRVLYADVCIGEGNTTCNDM